MPKTLLFSHRKSLLINPLDARAMQNSLRTPYGVLPGTEKVNLPSPVSAHFIHICFSSSCMKSFPTSRHNNCQHQLVKVKDIVACYRCGVSSEWHKCCCDIATSLHWIMIESNSWIEFTLSSWSWKGWASIIEFLHSPVAALFISHGPHPPHCSRAPRTGVWGNEKRTQLIAMQHSGATE